MSVLKSRAGLPIFTVILGSFALVILMLGVLFIFAIIKGARGEYEHELAGKHVLFANNLATLVHNYLDSHVRAISITASDIHDDSLVAPHASNHLSQLLHFYPNLHSAVLYQSNASSLSIVASAGAHPFPITRSIDYYTDGINRQISGVLTNPDTRVNCLLLFAPVTEGMILIAELSVSPIETLRSSFVFGQNGYAVVYDQNDRLVAHPESLWAAERKDVSNWSIIRRQRLMREGVDEFFSAYFNKAGVAAYATVPDYDWGILLPQHLSEIEQHIHNITTRQMTWFIIIVVMALALSRFLALWISRPIHALASHAYNLEDEQSACRLQISLAKQTPREINQLCYSLNTLLTKLRESHNRQAKYRTQIEYIADHSPLLMCVCDADGYINYAAGRLLSNFGHTPKTAIKLHIKDLIPAIPCSPDILERLRGGEEIVNTLSIDSTIIEQWCSSVKFNDHATSDYIMVLAIDVSDSHIAKLNARLLEDNRILNDGIIRAEENERRRIAGELHDLFGQDLSSIRNFTLLTKNLLNEGRPLPMESIQDIKGYIATIDQLASTLQEVIRSMLARLWPEALENIGLVGAIHDLVDNFKTLNPGIKLLTRVDFDERLLTDEQSIYIFRIISECLTNVSRHADASEVTFNVSIADNNLLDILIADNGVGFHPDNLPLDRYGIRGMKERARTLGGSCSVKSAPRKGSEIHVVIPIKQT